MGELERKFEAVRELREAQRRWREEWNCMAEEELRKYFEERKREIMVETQEGQEIENEI